MFGLLVFLVGCFPTIYEKEVGSDYKYKYGLIDERTGLIDTSFILVFRDPMMTFRFQIRDEKIDLEIENKTKGTLKIIWDEAVIIVQGEAHKAAHSFPDPDNCIMSSTPTIIPESTSIKEIVYPCDNIYFDRGWEIGNLFLKTDLAESVLKDYILSKKGAKISLHLPIKFNDNTILYKFNFIVVDVKPTKLN